MKEGGYWVPLFIFVTISVSLFFSECANSPPKKDGFEQTQLREEIKELTALSKPSASNKLKLARTCFWLGYLQNTIAILDPENHNEFINDINNLPDTVKEKYLLTEDELEDWEKNSPKQRAQASLYLGYSYLSLGYESEAYKNFIEAFEFYPDLKLDKEVLEKDEYLEGMIKNAKIAAQMEREFPPLVLFVAVDGSQSISKKQVDQIEKLQRKVKTRLKSNGEVLFYRFGNSPNRSPTLTSLSSSDSIIKPLRTDLWTDFRALFEELDQIIKEYSENSTEHQKAVLIISDGEHSVQGDLGGEREARIPENAANAIKTFSENYPDVPIVIITTDRMLKTRAIQSGFFYAAKWTKELEKHSAGKSFYYGPGSKPEEILTQAFDIIESYRNKVFITLDPNNKRRYSFNEKDECTVELVVRCTLPNVNLMVTGHPDWKIDSDIDIFPCKWEQTGKNTISITDSTPQQENLIIGCSNIEKASLVSREPRKFTLTFSRDEVEIGKLSLFFKQQLPSIEITKRSNKKVIMKSNAENSLTFQSKIDLPNHLKEPILLSVRVPDTNCFYEDEQKKIIPIDTTGSPGRDEFDLLIKTKRVDKFWSRISDDNISISFETNDRGTAYRVDTNQVGKIDFRVAPGWLYVLYQINQHVWIPSVAILICVALYPFFDDKIRTITRISGEEFTVSGNTIYDSKGRQILLLQQKWWFFKFELAKDSLKSGIEPATLFRQRSGKEKVDDKKTDLLSDKDRMKLIGTYRIILSEDRKTESKFNVDWNYRLQTWHKIMKWVWIPLGTCAIALGFADFYVPWPVPLLHIIIFGVLPIFLVIVFFSWKWWHSYRMSNSMDKLVSIGRGISLLDAVLSILEKIF